MAADAASRRGLPRSQRLRDGARYRIRPSGPADRERLAACFAALSPESRRLRFFGSKGTLQPTELDLYTNVDGSDHIALAAIRLDARGQEGGALGFARCLRIPELTQTAELSLTVLDGAQGQGVGAALLSRLIEDARVHGIHHLHCEILAENTTMRRMAEHLGGDARWMGDGTLTYDCPLPTRSDAAEEVSLPWLADPSQWLSTGTDAWLTGLETALTGFEAGHGAWDQWLAATAPGRPIDLESMPV
jgi:GNAT superfamily N-acetyltransferase